MDLGTLLQIAGRLTEHFLGESFSKFYSEGQSVLVSLLQLGQFLALNLEKNEPKEVLIELHCQTLASLRPFQVRLDIRFKNLYIMVESVVDYQKFRAKLVRKRAFFHPIFVSTFSEFSRNFINYSLYV